MAGPQLFRIRTFARKANPVGQSVEQVLAEAARAPAYSRHVSDPREPRVVFGLGPDEVRDRHDAMVATGGVSVATADGTVKRRGIRKDRPTLLTCIASHPHLVDQIAESPAAKIPMMPG